MIGREPELAYLALEQMKKNPEAWKKLLVEYEEKIKQVRSTESPEAQKAGLSRQG